LAGNEEAYEEGLGLSDDDQTGDGGFESVVDGLLEMGKEEAGSRIEGGEDLP